MKNKKIRLLSEAKIKQLLGEVIDKRIAKAEKLDKSDEIVSKLNQLQIRDYPLNKALLLSEVGQLKVIESINQEFHNKKRRNVDYIG